MRSLGVDIGKMLYHRIFHCSDEDREGMMIRIGFQGLKGLKAV